MTNEQIESILSQAQVKAAFTAWMNSEFSKSIGVTIQESIPDDRRNWQSGYSQAILDMSRTVGGLGKEVGEQEKQQKPLKP